MRSVSIIADKKSRVDDGNVDRRSLAANNGGKPIEDGVDFSGIHVWGKCDRNADVAV